MVAINACQPEPYRQGHTLYQYHCENCHMEDGSGLSALIPSLQKSSIIRGHPSELVCLIRYGLPKNLSTGQEMPANTVMNDVELTNLINYLRDAYLEKPVAVKVTEVHQWLEDCKTK